ncbi:MAG TPA: hypothetical protein VFB96_13325 [Pirellulaceae bacterium]|nr:hypothetical protein [Pirellulaceae bacterium]
MHAISGESQRTSDVGRAYQSVPSATAAEPVYFRTGWEAPPKRCRRARKRRGLAPLELTLSLPLLLFTMALMVALGAAATWKVRALVAARSTSWRHRWPRGGLFEEIRPAAWPVPATFNFAGAGNLAQIDSPANYHPVARGPLPQLDVDDRVLDLTKGLIEGESHHQRLPPMLASLGAYRHDVEHLLLDNKFQFSQMGIPGNTARRMPRLYVLDGNPSSYTDEDPHEWQIDRGLFNAYWSAKNVTQSRYNQDDLWILDRDQELRAWGMGQEFHPLFPTFTSSDRNEVRMNYLPRHQDRIYGWNDPSARNRRFDVPLHLCSGFIGLYQRQLAVLFPPPLMPPPNHHLLTKIKKLQDFRQQLQQPP